jgi:anti-sigma B factor antagonist
MCPMWEPAEDEPTLALSNRCVLLLGLEPTADEACVRIVGHGEIDMATAGQLDHEVRGAADRGAAGVTLDLSAIEFLDCTGLGVLLDLEHLAREGGWSFQLAYGAGAVQRLLELTGTTGRFTRAL